MVCAEDVVSYFRTLKSYERIWMMCKLQHCCLPFELRFLGTCLEELGKKDYNELRQAENEANSNAEANLAELRRIGDARVRNKIILYLSLLHSRNYSCSNSLFKILCDCQEVNAFLKCESSASPSISPPAPLPAPPLSSTSAAATASSSAAGSAAAAVPLAASNTAAASNDNAGVAASDDEEDSLEHLLMIYTLAVNHPAFSCEQKQTLQNIFDVIRAEQNKRSTLKRAASMGHALADGSLPTVGDNAVYAGASVQIQECQQPHPNVLLPENAYAGPHHLPNASHIPSVSQPFAHELSIPLAEQMSIGLPPPNFVRFPFAATPWSAAGIPIVFTATEPTNTTSHSFVSRSSSPSLSSSPTRSSSPSAKVVRPLSAPFARSPQMGGPVPQPASLPIPPTAPDPFAEMVAKEVPTVAAVLPNFASEQLFRLSDEELASLGMTEESIRRLRCVVDKRPTTDELPLPLPLPIPSIEKGGQINEPVEMDIGVMPNAGLLYATSMTVPATIVPNSAASHQCPLCQAGSNIAAAHINGFVSELVPSCIDHDMSVLRLDADGPSRNSNSSNSEGTSSDQSSPPNTPLLVQNSFNKRNNKNSVVHEWNRGGTHGSSNNNNNDNGSSNVSYNKTGGGGGGGSSSSSSSSGSNNRGSHNNKNSGAGNSNANNNNVSNINRHDRSSALADERSNAGDSSSEERNYSMAGGYQGRGRVVNSSSSGGGGGRGRPKTANSYNRGRGNQRRRNEAANSSSGANSEDVARKTTTPFALSNAETTPAATPFQYSTAPAVAVTAATVTNAAYIPPHLIRSYGSFPASGYIRPPYPAAYAPGGEILYHHHHPHHHQHQYPPPPPLPAAAATAFLPAPIPYSTLVQPKLSCYNCGSQSHHASDCAESTLEEASKQGQYRLDFAPSADKSFPPEK